MLVLPAVCAAVWFAVRRRRRERGPEVTQLAEMAEVQAALARANDDLLGALRRGDAHAYAGAYADDAVSMPSGGPIVRGRMALEVALQRTFERVRFLEATMATTDTRVNGASAIEVGRYRFVILAIDSQRQQTIEGRYMLMWTRVEHGWRIAVDAAQRGAPE